MKAGIRKFVLIGENVLNFHYSDDAYYEEWFEDVMDEEGWIVMLNFREHVLKEFEDAGINHYFLSGSGLENISWRAQNPEKIAGEIDRFVQIKLGL